MENTKLKTEQEQCKVAAGIAADALIDAGLLAESDIDLASEIILEELLVSKALNKL